MLLETGDNKWCVIKTVGLWQSVTVIENMSALLVGQIMYATTVLSLFDCQVRVPQFCLHFCSFCDHFRANLPPLFLFAIIC